MRNKFFELMQNNTEADIKAGFQSYSMNYTSDSVIYADAELSWMDSENRDYLLNRNISLYSVSNNKILE
jgi:hypothetical protein